MVKRHIVLSFYIALFQMSGCVVTSQDEKQEIVTKIDVNFNVFPKLIGKCLGRNDKFEKSFILLGDGNLCSRDHALLTENVLVANEMNGVWKVGVGFVERLKPEFGLATIDCHLDTIVESRLEIMDSLYSKALYLGKNNDFVVINRDVSLPMTRVYIDNEAWDFSFGRSFDSMRKDSGSIHEFIDLVNAIYISIGDCDNFPNAKKCAYALKLKMAFNGESIAQLGCNH